MKILYSNNQTNAKSTIWPHIFDWINDQFEPFCDILDLGSGAHIWHATNSRMTRIDHFKRKIESYQKDFVLGDLNYGIPLSNKTIDYAVAVEVIEHLENPLFFLREIKRVVKKKAIITCPNGIESGWYTPWTYTFFGHVTILSDWLLENHFKRAGLEVLEKKYDSENEEIVLFLIRTDLT